MKQRADDWILRNSVFIWILVATFLVLLVPYIGMQLTDEVRWNETDFVVMGILLFGSGSLFVLAARRVPRKHRVIVGGVFVIAFLYVWLELAVGVFTNLGS